MQQGEPDYAKECRNTVKSWCPPSGMIPSALDKEDTYSLLIPLKEKPLIHPASDPSSLIIILTAFQNSSFNSSSARAHAVRMNKQNKARPEYQCGRKYLYHKQCWPERLAETSHVELRPFFFIHGRTLSEGFLLNAATRGYRSAASTA